MHRKVWILMAVNVKEIANAPVKLLLTIPEVSHALGLGRSAVYELVLLGEIPSLKIGRARRVPLKGLEEFVARHLGDSTEGYGVEI
jgi:excisionase family DNA binding protein